MLLQTLYDLAVEKKLFEQVHLQERSIHLLIPINSKGELLGNCLIPLTSKDEKGKDVLGMPFLMPRFPGENNGGKAYFLAESCSAILGIDSETGEGLPMPEKKKSNPAKSHSHFWQRIQSARDATFLPTLDTLLRFRERYLYVEGGRCQHRLPFIRLGKSKSGKSQLEARISAPDNWVPAAKLTISFQIDGDIVFQADPGNPINLSWRDTYHREAFTEENDVDETSGPANHGLCLITARNHVPIARSHKPKILKIPGLTSGGYLVSFAKECPAFSSYGFEMGENAPVSEEAAASYALALQSLLDSDDHSLRVGPAVVCFWAKTHREEPSFVVRILTRPDPKAVREFLKTPWSGVDRSLAKHDQFYSVAFSGNAGRVAVRHWMQTTVEQARKNMQKWFKDLEVAQFGTADSDEREGMPSLALFRLACTTVRQSKDLHGDVLTHLYRAAIEGTAPPTSWIKSILDEVRSALASDSQQRPKYPFNSSRFALLKLILNRNKKEGEPVIQPEIFETDDPAYNCGRLLAVLADAQSKAHEFGLQGPGAAERYFGAASVSPASVFPLLLKLNRHHIDKIRKSGKYSSHVQYIESDMENILALFKPDAAAASPEFPRHLSLQAQGRFAIGFYQQRAAFAAARREHQQSAKAQPQTSQEEDPS